jgi:hypothetical protein
MHERFRSLEPKKLVSKWRLVFLVFLVIYLLVLLSNLGVMAVRWDEANHLDGGLLLLHGRLGKYMSAGLFYPPLDDLILVCYFAIAGPSVFVGRLIGVTFSVLSVWVVFEFANRTYGPKTALVSSILLATMPGFFWLSRLAMLETMLIFFFSASMMLFFLWLQKHQNKYLVLSGVALGLGFLTKYQIIIAAATMALTVLFLCRGYIKARLSRFPLLILVASVVVLPWIIISYQAYSTGMVSQWVYAMNMGNPLQSTYSVRFPSPVFYLVEMTWPYGAVHPVSFFVYVLGLLGLGFLLWRRKAEDKFFLVWFVTIYVFFSLIGNKQWRYIVPVFPVLAISAASLIASAYEKADKRWSQSQKVFGRIHFGKVAAGVLITITVFSVAYSCVDAYSWVVKDSTFNLPLKQATDYATSKLESNGSLVVLCPVNVFSSDIVKFFVHAKGFGQTYVGQYPDLPVDTYQPSFNVTELVGLCQNRNVKYLLLYEYGETYPFFDSTLNVQSVYSNLINSSSFSCVMTFGSYPGRIFLLSFSG